MCILSVIYIARYQNAKMHATHTIWEKETIYPQMYLLSNRMLDTKTIKSKTLLKTSLQYFQLLTYQNAKTHTKISYIEKQNNVTKKKYFECFFEFVMLRNDKIYVKYPIWRNEKIL